MVRCRGFHENVPLCAAAVLFCALTWVVDVCDCVLNSPSPASLLSSSSYWRLPTVTSPVSYDLRVEPDLIGAESTFAGVTKIAVTASARTNVVTLNLVNLTVTAVTVTDGVVVTDVRYLADREQLEIRVAGHLVPGRVYVVTITYHGSIRDDMTGLFLASYVEDNTTKWMAVTDFQPSTARRAFPCFDEPQFKAKFNISVVRQKHQTVVSNMPVQRIEDGPDDNTEVVYFETTPPMSTYLVAFYIGEFVSNENDENISVYTHKKFINQTEYLGVEAWKHLRVMEEYTGINYTLPKLDLLAVPSLTSGAMENWGMITFMEKYVILPEESRTFIKMKAVLLMQHEFAHQWFGNLVTCSWWSHLWLNEGFSTYFQYFAAGMVRTEWPVEELFILEVHQVTLNYDQDMRRSISGVDNDNLEIDNFFDEISYRKSASILRMLKYLVTENLFKLSLRDYLNNKKESVAEPNDLYASFDRVLIDNNYTITNDLTVKEFMLNWTLQSGYPVINVTKNETTSTFIVTQSRFLIGEEKEESIVIDTSGAWHIGLTYTTESTKNFHHTSPFAWTNKTSKFTVIPAPPNSGWYIFNVQSVGLYRVNYDIDNWNALIRQLHNAHTEVHVLNRAQLINDAFNLALAGLLNYSVPVHLSKYLKEENETLPWYSAMNGFVNMIGNRHLNETDQFKDYVGELAGVMFKKLDNLVSSGNKDAIVNRAWEYFSKWACWMENVDCTVRAMEYFKRWEAGEKIPDDIKEVAFCEGVKRSNGSGTFYRMVDVYKTTTSISEKSLVEVALMCTTNMSLLSEYRKSKSDSIKRSIQKFDLSSPTFSLLEISLKFLKLNLKKLFKSLGIANYIQLILLA